MKLTEFLLARIQDDEFTAQAAIMSSAHWKPYYDGDGYREVHDDDGERIVLPVDERPTQQAAEHIARHDPARVLAECEAKRRIVKACSDPAMPVDSGRFVAAGVLALLALPYASHPDYREDWRP